MRLSIVIPVLNRADYLPRLFQSFRGLAQAEVIFVDNGSTDNSVALLEAFAAKDNDFAVKVLSEPKPGACAARNTGMKVAQGDWIFFFDSDDLLSTVFFDDAMDDECDVVCAPTKMIFSDGRQKNRYFLPTGKVSDQVLTGMISTQTFIAKRQWLMENVGLWNEELSRWQDWEYGTRLLLAEPKMKWLTIAYHRIYQHSESISGTKWEDDAENLLNVLKSVEKLPLDQESQRALTRRAYWLAEKTKSIEIQSFAENLPVQPKVKIMEKIRVKLPGALRKI